MHELSTTAEWYKLLESFPAKYIIETIFFSEIKVMHIRLYTALINITLMLGLQRGNQTHYLKNY